MPRPLVLASIRVTTNVTLNSTPLPSTRIKMVDIRGHNFAKYGIYSLHYASLLLEYPPSLHLATELYTISVHSNCACVDGHCLGGVNADLVVCVLWLHSSSGMNQQTCCVADNVARYVVRACRPQRNSSVAPNPKERRVSYISQRLSLESWQQHKHSNSIRIIL